MKIILNSFLLVLILFQGILKFSLNLLIPIVSFEVEIVCPDGYGAYNNACEKCFDPECKSCERTGASEEYQKCTSCISGFYLNDRTCDPCYDIGCADCSGGGPEKCLTCNSGYSKSSDGVTCQPCEDEGCGSCSGDTSTCSACAADYYMKDNKCVSCGQGKSSPPGSTSIDACISKQTFYSLQSYLSILACDDSFCKSCNGVAGTGKCQTCNPTYFLTPSSTCQHCDDDNCLACSGSGLHQCTICAANYDGFNRACTPCPAGMRSEPGGFCEGTLPDRTLIKIFKAVEVKVARLVIQ